ncbi:hypothetical protein [Fictibacillus sp. 26RED30]|uniref:hypothetical protein n=1 Tax=Fictibacillus sp. 26RED30 TaxID=2745877 RepID=UPI0018CF2329|nr:hypothetical protein [Fictibacillus sp. 26RED30]MBH0163214.1 hypothetical protein [Fictibacillus sp. 26RED30]
MSKKEKRWRRVYFLLYLLIYGLVAPLSLILFVIGEESFPFFIIPVVLALPAMKNNHIQKIREREGLSKS